MHAKTLAYLFYEYSNSDWFPLGISYLKVVLNGFKLVYI